MKRISIVLVVLFCQNLIFSQNCIPLAVVFSKQSQIDSFPINYPGCTIIDGNLGVSNLIDPLSPIQNLDSLGKIREVHGSVQLLSSTLNDIKGLKNLKKINGSLSIENSQCSNFTGLDSLERIGGNFNIQNNPALDSLYNLDSLKFIGGNLSISSIALSVINSFNNVDTINGHFSVAGYLTMVNAFNNVDYIGGGMSFQSYSPNCEYNVFNNIDSCYWGIGINSLNTNTTINGFNKLRKLGYLGLNGNINFSNSFDSLQIVAGNLGIENNQTFSNLVIFPKLDSVLGNFSITSNPLLLSISVPNSLKYIYDLQILSNPFLSDISSFGTVEKIDLEVRIEGNTFLSSCGIFPICSLISRNGYFSFWSNSIGCNSVDEVTESCPNPQDSDGDGINDYIDNCIQDFNPGQEDFNNDGVGDACQDTDNDSLNDNIDNCPMVSNSNQLDTDNDGVGDVCDNCINNSNSGQEDCNNNGIGNVCDIPDNDCDGIPNTVDNCPDVYNPLQIDINNNGIGDNCEFFPKIGINTNEPKAEFHLSNGNLYIDNPAMKIIYKLPNGQCYTYRPLNVNQPPIMEYCPCPN